MDRRLRYFNISYKDTNVTLDEVLFHFRLEISPLGSHFADCSARGVLIVQSILVYYSKVLRRNSFLTNDHTLGFCP